MTQEALKLALEALDVVKLHYTQNRHVNEAITALREALAEQPAQQEPGRNHWEDGDVFERIAASKKQPAQRKPLTDEEIEAMWPLRPTDSVIQFARAIEAKLKEKNT